MFGIVSGLILLLASPAAHAVLPDLEGAYRFTDWVIPIEKKQIHLVYASDPPGRKMLARLKRNGYACHEIQRDELYRCEKKMGRVLPEEVAEKLVERYGDRLDVVVDREDAPPERIEAGHWLFHQAISINEEIYPDFMYRMTPKGGRICYGDEDGARGGEFLVLDSGDLAQFTVWIDGSDAWSQARYLVMLVLERVD